MVKLELLPEEEMGGSGNVEVAEGEVPRIIFTVKEEDVKEEPLEDVGPAMREFLARQFNASVEVGVVPGVSSRPHGNVPSLLGFSEPEIQQMLGSRAGEVFVPYLGEASRGNDQPLAELQPVAYSAESSGGQRSCKRLTCKLTTRQSKREHSKGSSSTRSKKRKFCHDRGFVRTLSTINREARNRPLQMIARPQNLALVPSHQPVSVVPPVKRSWHRRKYDESSEGFGRTGRYHPEDARLIRLGTWEAMYEDLGFYRIPPAWWPHPLTAADFYSGSSGGDNGSSDDETSTSSNTSGMLTYW